MKTNAVLDVRVGLLDLSNTSSAQFEVPILSLELFNLLRMAAKVIDQVIPHSDHASAVSPSSKQNPKL
jgi:hypothetical protein